jgi:hypothetical protein
MSESRPGFFGRLKRRALDALADRVADRMPRTGNGDGNTAQAAIATLGQRIDELQGRLAYAEQRTMGPHYQRWAAIINAADYLVGAQVPGDYAEFGVFEGKTFAFACNTMCAAFKDMRFIAFDSFEGLPVPQGRDAQNGYSSSFAAGQFACSQEMFSANLRQSGVDMNRVRMVKGWFDKTLVPATAAQLGLTRMAAAWIDCDLYESTVPVLRFIRPYLSHGSILLFDDWRCFRNQPDYGQQRACKEWLAANPELSLVDLFSIGWHGRACVVHLR